MSTTPGGTLRDALATLAERWKQEAKALRRYARRAGGEEEVAADARGEIYGACAENLLAALAQVEPQGQPFITRVKRNDDGSLDEVVADGTVHLEQMDDDHWSLIVSRDREWLQMAVWGEGPVTVKIWEPAEYADPEPAPTLPEEGEREPQSGWGKWEPVVAQLHALRTRTTKRADMDAVEAAISEIERIHHATPQAGEAERREREFVIREARAEQLRDTVAEYIESLMVALLGPDWRGERCTDETIMHVASCIDGLSAALLRSTGAPVGVTEREDATMVTVGMFARFLSDEGAISPEQAHYYAQQFARARSEGERP